MKKNKRKFHITKQTVKYAAIFVIGGLIFVAIQYFFINYEFQSPIRSRWISPLIENSNPTVIMPLEDFSEDKAGEGVKATPSPTPSKRTFSNEKILAGVYVLESSGGKNDTCKRQGKFNGYGYAPGTCYDSHEEVTAKVDAWFTRQLKTKTLAQSLCYYNTGYVKDDCSYYQNFLALND